jgi:hypothetical protein
MNDLAKKRIFCIALLIVSFSLSGMGCCHFDPSYVSMNRLNGCLDKILMTNEQALQVLESVHFVVSELDSFSNIAADSTCGLYTDTGSSPVYEIKTDILKLVEQEINQFRPRASTASVRAFEFHSKIVHWFNSLHDAHTVYESPFSIFSVIFPVIFGSKLEDGNQVVTLRTPSDFEALKPVYEILYGKFPLDSEFLSSQPVIRTINGEPALNFLINLVSTGPLIGKYPQMEQRLNAFIFSANSIQMNLGQVTRPSFSSLKLVFEDGKRTSLELIGLYSLPQNLVIGKSSKDLSAYMHTNDRLAKFKQGPKNFRELAVDASVPETTSIPDIDFEEISPSTNSLSVHRKSFTSEWFVSKTDGPVLDLPTSPFKQSGGLEFKIVQDRNIVIVKVQSFAVDNDKYFSGMVAIQQEAIRNGVSRILFDVSGNSGGSVSSAYALIWFLWKRGDESICQKYRTRLSDFWTTWINIYKNGLFGIYKQHYQQVVNTATGTHLNACIERFFTKGKAMIDLLFDELGDAYLPTLLRGEKKEASLVRMEEVRADIQTVPTDRAKRTKFEQCLMSLCFFTPTLSHRLSQLFSTQVFPFDENFNLNGEPETKFWGKRHARYSQPFILGSDCRDVVRDMHLMFSEEYDRSHWTQIGIVSDGTCGSACALFASTIEAVSFSFGGLAGKPLDVSAFAGGTAFDYDSVWPKLVVGTKLAELFSDNEHVDLQQAPPIRWKGKLQFNFSMLQDRVRQLPRQFYFKPAVRHFNVWGLDNREEVYRRIALVGDWNSLETDS